MRRKRHYVKIPQTIATWVPGGATGDWQTAMWKDIANDGKELFLDYLEPNERGSRSALYGEKFYVEIGYDRDRADTVFVTRVQSADLRLPRRTPLRLKVELVMWPGGYPPDLDRLDDLFLSDTLEAEEPSSTQAVEASPLLLSLLATVPEAMRQRLRPGTDVGEPGEPRAFLAPFRQLRARYRLDRHLQLSPRHDLLLRTTTTPTELSRAERDAFLAAFGIGLLNDVALADKYGLTSVVESLAALHIPPSLRAQMWAASLEMLSAPDFRRELHVCGDELNAIASGDDEASVAWRVATGPTLRQVGQRSDEVLRDLLAEATDDRSALVALASWARNLAFSDTPKQEDVSPGARVEPARVDQPVSLPDRAVADKWVMKLRLPDEQPLERLRRALTQQAQAVHSTPPMLASVEALLDFDKEALALSSLAAEWRDAVGDTGALRADLIECQAALASLQEVLGVDAERVIQDHYVLPSEVLEISRVVRHPLMAEAPDWLLSVGAETERPARPTNAADWAILLVHNERRRCVQMFCDLATELNEPQSVKWLTAPEPGAEADGHLREWFERVRSFLLDLPVEMRGLVGVTTDFQRGERGGFTTGSAPRHTAIVSVARRRTRSSGE